MRRYRLFTVLAVVLLMITAAVPVGAVRKAKVGVAYDVAGPTGTLFNSVIHSGVVRAETDLGVKLSEMDQATSWGIEFAGDDIGFIAKLGKKSDLVIGSSFIFAGAVSSVALDDPETDYVVIDAVVPAAPNLLGTSMAANEGSFLVGAAAGLASTTNQIGFIGGVDFPLIGEFEAGFVAGVASTNPGASVAVAYLSTPPDFSGFADPTQAHDVAEAMYTSGVDVIYHASGSSGFGLFPAAFEHTTDTGNHVWAIGVDVDQYLQVPAEQKPHVLTSMVKNFDVVAYDVIESHSNGTFASGHQHWDLAAEGVDYSTTGGFVDVYVPVLEGLRDDIIDGTIVVPSVP